MRLFLACYFVLIWCQVDVACFTGERRRVIMQRYTMGCRCGEGRKPINDQRKVRESAVVI